MKVTQKIQTAYDLARERYAEIGVDTEKVLPQLEQKSMPWSALWEYYCLSHGIPEGIGWLQNVRSYELETLPRRK